MEVLKTRLASTGAAEAKRIPTGGVEHDTPNSVDGRRERAPVRGVKGSDISAQSSGETQLDGKRERAPAQGAEDSDIPAQSSGKPHGGAVKDALDIGKGARERAPVKGVMDSDNPSQ